MKDKAREILIDIYKRYFASGENGVYFYGSILRDDFNPETSDIDSIAIVSDEITMDIEKQIQDELAKALPEVKKFGFRLLYKSEISGGEIKSFVGSVISPKALLLDLPNWEHIAGQKFTLDDFPGTSFEEAITDEIALIQRLHWDQVKNIPENKHEFFIKKLVELIYLIYQKEQGPKPFSYNILSGMSEPAAAALIECRQSQYDEFIFQKYDATFQNFIDKIIIP